MKYSNLRMWEILNHLRIKNRVADIAFWLISRDRMLSRSSIDISVGFGGGGGIGSVCAVTFELDFVRLSPLVGWLASAKFPLRMAMSWTLESMTFMRTMTSDCMSGRE